MTAVPKRGITTIDLSKYTRRRRGYVREDELNYEVASVIALDPGGTTGWSMINVVPEVLIENDAYILDNILSHQHGQVDCGMHRGNLGESLHDGISTDGEFSGIYDLSKFIQSWPSASVVVEDFVLRTYRMDRDLLSPVRVTSAIGYVMWKDGRDYHIQSPADAKRVCTDERLKEWGMYDARGSLNHARDADRHAILFLRRAKDSAKLRALAWPHLFGRNGAYV